MLEDLRRAEMPPVIRGLTHLGLYSKDIAGHLGVSTPTFINWASNKYPIPIKHQNRLIVLLRTVISTIGQESVPSNSKDRIEIAKEDLREAENG